MKKFFYIFIFLIPCSCNNKTTQESDIKVIIDPNPTSEMAQLMREMSIKLENIKESIINKEKINQNLLDFALIHEQNVTDPSFSKDHIKPMSISFAYSVEQFNEKPNKANYSAIINNCMNCHQLSCPGPIVKINKLRINN